MPTSTVINDPLIGDLAQFIGHKWWGWELELLDPTTVSQHPHFETRPNTPLYTLVDGEYCDSGWFVDSLGEPTDEITSGGRFAWFNQHAAVAEHNGIYGVHRRLSEVLTFTPAGNTTGHGLNLYHQCITEYPGNTSISRLWLSAPGWDMHLQLAWGYGGSIGDPSVFLDGDCPRSVLDNVIHLILSGDTPRTTTAQQLREDFISTDCTLRDAWSLIPESVDSYIVETWPGVNIDLS